VVHFIDFRIEMVDSHFESILLEKLLIFRYQDLLEEFSVSRTLKQFERSSDLLASILLKKLLIWSQIYTNNYKKMWCFSTHCP
ncbi:hypothetical protein Csa_022367, partial [Cucumis sativus]